MKILFTISVCSFCLLLLAVYAVARHIRRSQPAALEAELDPTPVEPILTHPDTISDASSSPGWSQRSQSIQPVRYASVPRREAKPGAASPFGHQDSLPHQRAGRNAASAPASANRTSPG